MLLYNYFFVLYTLRYGLVHFLEIKTPPNATVHGAPSSTRSLSLPLPIILQCDLLSCRNENHRLTKRREESRSNMSPKDSIFTNIQGAYLMREGRGSLRVKPIPVSDPEVYTGILNIVPR